MKDLEHETQVFMFTTYVLKVDPIKLDTAGYHCLRNFFETINLSERKLRKTGASYHSLVGGTGGGVVTCTVLMNVYRHTCCLDECN